MIGMWHIEWRETYKSFKFMQSFIFLCVCFLGGFFVSFLFLLFFVCLFVVDTEIPFGLIRVECTWYSFSVWVKCLLWWPLTCSQVKWIQTILTLTIGLLPRTYSPISNNYFVLFDWWNEKPCPFACVSLPHLFRCVCACVCVCDKSNLLIKPFTDKQSCVYRLERRKKKFTQQNRSVHVIY